MATAVTLTYTDTTSNDIFNNVNQTGVLKPNTGSTPYLQNNYQQGNLTSGITPFGYISSCATNLNIKLDDYGANDDIQIFTRDGKHVYGTSLGSGTMLGAGLTSSNIKSKLFQTKYGFTSGAVYDSSGLINSSIVSNNSTQTGFGVTVNTVLKDDNSSGNTLEEINIANIPEDLVIVFTGSGSFAIQNISYTAAGAGVPTYYISTPSGASVSSYKGSYGTLSVNNTTGAYSFVPDDAAIEKLKAGTFTEAFNVVSSVGGSCQETTPITITITGEDDKPICTGVPNAGSVVESKTTSTNAQLLNFTDPDGYVVDVANTNTVGTYGNLTLIDNSDGTWSWKYDLDMTNPAVLALTNKDFKTDTFTVVTTDGVSCKINVDVQGYNAMALAPVTIAYIDTSADDTFNTETGTLVATDAADATKVLYHIESKSAVKGIGTSESLVGKYGTLIIDSKTGDYQYIPNDNAIESLQSNTYEEFILSAYDGTSKVTSTFRVNISAVDDVPEIDTVCITYIDTTADDTFYAKTGKINFSDRDSSVPLTISGATTQKDLITTTGKYGKLTFNTKTGDYTFAPDDKAIEALKANTTESFTINTGGTDGKIEVCITATNDFAEPKSYHNQINETQSNILGRIDLIDRDDKVSADIVPQPKQPTTYGYFTVDKYGKYKYELNPSTCYGYLTEGDVLTDVISFTTQDGQTSSLTIDIFGSDGVATAKDDKISGTSCPDVLKGLAGNDTIDGKTNDDTMIGGDGNDTYFVDSENDVIQELSLQQSGLKDTIKLNILAPTAVYTLATNVENLDIISKVAQDVDGNYLSNQLKGNDRANVLNGLSGNDTLDGGKGDDTLDGGEGNDLLMGGLGVDNLVGGNGDDRFMVDLVNNAGTVEAEDTVTEIAAGGTDHVTFTYTNKSKTIADQTITLYADIENATLDVKGVATAKIILVGNALDNILLGNASDNTLKGDAGKDTLKGDNGNDALYGEDGNDTLEGGSGNDTLDGGLGDDFMQGGLGNDVYYVDSVSDSIIEKNNQGTDTVYVSVSGYFIPDFVEKAVINDASITSLTGNDQKKYFGRIYK